MLHSLWEWLNDLSHDELGMSLVKIYIKDVCNNIEIWMQFRLENRWISNHRSLTWAPRNICVPVFTSFLHSRVWRLATFWRHIIMFFLLNFLRFNGKKMATPKLRKYCTNSSFSSENHRVGIVTRFCNCFNLNPTFLSGLLASKLHPCIKKKFKFELNR